MAPTRAAVADWLRTGLRLGVATVGLCALVAAFVLTWAPWLVSPVVAPASHEGRVAEAATAIFGVTGLLGLALAAASSTPDRAAPASIRPLDRVRDGPASTEAERFEAHLRAVVDVDDESRDGDAAAPRDAASGVARDAEGGAHREADRAASRDAVRSALERVATSTVAAVDRVGPDAARDRVRAGEWTDDPVAAAALADGRALPLGWRLFGWLFPDLAYRRLVERTIRAVETYGGEPA